MSLSTKCKLNPNQDFKLDCTDTPRAPCDAYLMQSLAMFKAIARCVTIGNTLFLQLVLH